MSNKITLHGFGPALDLPDPSPFVVKMETYLRMADVPFEKVSRLSNLGKAPKKKLPFIVDDGITVPDSEFIIQHLREKHQIDLDDWLSNENKSQAYLMRKSLDENFYWCVVYARWGVDATWAQYKKALFAKLPAPARLFLPPLARRGILKTLYQQGLGRHSFDEVKTITNNTLSALSHVLADQTYFFGDQPSSLDATAYAFVSAFTQIQLDVPFKEEALKHRNLVEFCERVRDSFY